MPRFFVSPEDIGEEEITVRERDAHHIARSLRMAEGDRIEISDGRGNDYICRLTKIRDEECLCRIEERCSSPAEPPCRITLFMAYPKGDKMETVVQKAVELGASRIVPFESSRCIKRPAEDRAERLGIRLNRIAEEAAKQCGRSVIPSVERIATLEEVTGRLGDFSAVLLCYEGERTVTVRRALDRIAECGIPDTMAVIVGSEGGFSPDEAEKFIRGGAISVSLGRRILRCETAPDYALSAISYRFEL